MAVHTTSDGTHIATLEGRSMVEYTVAKNADETNQIDGNIYVGRIQNVLPGMELAFVDIGIPKNAVLYKGDVSFDTDDVDGAPRPEKRIEEMIRAGQTVLCQVTKNAIGAKGARLTQEVSSARTFRRARAELVHHRYLQASARRGTSSPSSHHRRREARTSRHHHPHRRRRRVGRRPLA